MRLWDVQTGRQTRRVMFDGEPTFFVSWSGRDLIVGTNESEGLESRQAHGKVRILWGAEPYFVRHEQILPSAVFAAALSRDGQALVSACQDGVHVHLVDPMLPLGYHVGPIGHARTTCCLALPFVLPLPPRLDPEALTCFAIGCWGARFYVLGVGDIGVVPRPVPGSMVLFEGNLNAGVIRGDVNCCCANPAGDRVVTGSRNGEILPWDLRRGGDAHPVGQEKDGVTTCHWSPDGRLLLTGTADGSVACRNADSDQVVARWRHASYVTGCAWDPKMRFCLTTADRLAYLWSVPSEERASHPDGRRAERGR